MQDRAITVPIIDHHRRAEAMLDTVAREWGVEPEAITRRNVDFIVGHLADVEAAARKDERAQLEYGMAQLRAKVNEAMGLVQPLVTRVGELESRIDQRDKTIEAMAQTIAERGLLEDGR